jgi:predicted transcriptional regulator
MDAGLSEIVVSIDELASRARISRNRAFAAWYTINFFDIDEDEALEAAAADGGNDQGIDSVFADEGSQEIVAIQAYCPENFEKKTPKSKWDAAVSSAAFLRKPDNLVKAGRPDLAEQISQLMASNPTYTLAIGLISLGTQSIEIAGSVKAHQDDKDKERITYFFSPQSEVVAKYKALVGSEEGISEEVLTFSGPHIEDRGAYGKAWIGSVSATELQRLHGVHGDKLFAGNIRLFLGARKGGINEQIINTAKESPGTFWALNNGITIVADTAETVPGARESSQLKLRRFSIVNGCQTTSSLVRAEASAETKVLTRVIAAKAALRNEIVRYNNSQNAIKIWTVRAADTIQQQLRNEFKVVSVSYAPKQEGSRKKKNEITIELDKVTQYLASAENAFLLQAIDNKSELFDQPYQKLFYRGIQATQVYLAWLVGSSADEERQTLLDGMKGDQNVGLLSVTSTYWIVYCTYKLLAKYGNVSSSSVTLAKMRSLEFKNAVKKYVKKAGELFFDAAVDTYDRDEYGSFKSTLRSTKFLQKVDSKLNIKIARLTSKALPDLSAVCKSIKG